MDYSIPSNHWELFWGRVEPWAGLDACWEWTGRTDRHGYGVHRVKSVEHGDRSLLAHRLSYLLLVGELPEGLVCDHLCRNRTCVNPDHIEMVTPAENLRRIPRFSRSRRGVKWTHCRRGHPFSKENTRLNTNGHQVCKTCDAMRRERKRSAA